MYKADQDSSLKVFLSKKDAGRVGGYVLRNPQIEIVSIDRIGEYWLMSLSSIDPVAKADIIRIVGFSTDHDQEGNSSLGEAR